MGKRVLAGLAAGLYGIALTTGASAQVGAPQPMRAPGPIAAPAPHLPQDHGAWGRRIDGRWAAGGSAPGGWNGYYRPVAGWSLPNYWINPDFYIADWRGYGLPAPAAGYGWSRYYDDAVLTDRYGRVSDVRYGWDWDRYGGYDDGYYAPGYVEERRERTGNTVAGAVVGGLVGGVAGNAIAGRGNRLAGTLVGAGVGAVAGGVIGDATSRHKRSRKYRDYPAAPLTYDGQWQGNWTGRDGATYSGTYDGRWQGDVRGAYPAYAVPAPLPYAPAPAYGYGYGYDYGASSYYSAVDYVAPTVVTETVVTEETSYAARSARRATVRKAARPRVRVVCCRCGC